MNGWLIYNGALRMDKVKILVQKLAHRAAEKGIHLELIRNNEIIPQYTHIGDAFVHLLTPASHPDFVIFWDKDLILAKHLEKIGYPLFNTSSSIEQCDNKALMHLQTAGLKIAVPKTIAAPFVFFEQTLPAAYADYVFDTLGCPVILKECYGSFGMQVYLINSKSQLEKKIKKLGKTPFILQEFIPSSFGRDVRVNIIGNQVVGAMERNSENDFRANITLGGTAKTIRLSKEWEDFALVVHHHLGLHFSGVDILYGENGPVLCEVNSNVNYISFEEVSGVDFSGMLLDYIVHSMRGMGK